MRILFISTAHNSLSQRLAVEAPCVWLNTGVRRKPEQLHDQC